MWTLVIFATGVGPNPSTAIGKIDGFLSSAECFKQAEEIEKTREYLLSVLRAMRSRRLVPIIR